MPCGVTSVGTKLFHFIETLPLQDPLPRGFLLAYCPSRRPQPFVDLFADSCYDQRKALHFMEGLMPSIQVDESTFHRLAARAATLNVTVEELVTPALQQVAAAEPANGHPTAPPGDLSNDQWTARFDQFLATARSRADRYPPGFEADVSRESIYEGCGE